MAPSVPVTPAPPVVNRSIVAIYDFVSSNPYVSSYTSASRFVFYDNGTFALQYPGNEYGGTYTEVEGRLQFDFDGWNSAGPWIATGVRIETALAVSYNVVMQLADFEDAVYELRP